MSVDAKNEISTLGPKCHTNNLDIRYLPVTSVNLLKCYSSFKVSFFSSMSLVKAKTMFNYKDPRIAFIEFGEQGICFCDSP